MTRLPARVIMLTNNVTPDVLGGLNRYVRELSAELVRRGVSTTVVTKRAHAGLVPVEVGDDGVEVVRYAMPSKRSPLFALAYVPAVARGVLAGIRRHPRAGAVLHGHFVLPELIPAALGRPYVRTFHAPVYRELLSERQDSYVLPRPVRPLAVRGMRLAEAVAGRRADGTVVLSEFTRRELALLAPEAARRAVLVPGGLDIDRFCPGPAASRGAWADQADPLLFTARRLTPRMGLLELVRAMPTVLAACPGARLAIAGRGGMQADIEREVAALGLGHAVRLLGYVPDDELLAWYRRAAAVVMPTTELEGFGLTTAEALATGTPVVGTPAGATPEILAPLDPRLVARDSSAAAIADAIMALFADPDLLRQVRAASRARVAPAMGWSAVADRYLELYEPLLG